MDTRCTVCKKDAQTLSKDPAVKGMFCVRCQKFYCAQHRTIKVDGKVRIKTCNKGHDDPKKELCATCNAVIWVDMPYVRGGIHCLACKKYYCYNHCKTTEWERVAAGVDAAIRHVTCDKGHSFTQSES